MYNKLITQIAKHVLIQLINIINIYPIYILIYTKYMYCIKGYRSIHIKFYKCTAYSIALKILYMLCTLNIEL